MAGTADEIHILDCFDCVDQLHHHVLAGVVDAQGPAQYKSDHKGGGTKQGTGEGIESPRFTAELVHAEFRYSEWGREGHHCQE
jgi:hypothetical protein